MSDYYAGMRVEGPSNFKKFMNPEASLINGVLGGSGDEKFKSYLNPLFSYSNDESVRTLEKWSDPLFTTYDRNSKKHLGYLNPIHTLFTEDTKRNKAKSFIDPLLATADKNTGKRHFGYLNPVYMMFSEDTKENKVKSVIDPGLSAATSFIKDDKARETVSAVLNPVGWIIGKLF